jgi:putative membrane protein
MVNGFLGVVALVHLGFMLAELFPWHEPKLLKLAGSKLPAGSQWNAAQLDLVAAVVHNAGIYNGILAGGLFWAAAGGDPSGNVARVLLIGAVVAGVFGTATLKSWATAAQAALGLAGLYLMR